MQEDNLGKVIQLFPPKKTAPRTPTPLELVPANLGDYLKEITEYLSSQQITLLRKTLHFLSSRYKLDMGNIKRVRDEMLKPEKKPKPGYYFAKEGIRNEEKQLWAETTIPLIPGFDWKSAQKIFTIKCEDDPERTVTPINGVTDGLEYVPSSLGKVETFFWVIVRMYRYHFEEYWS